MYDLAAETLIAAVTHYMYLYVHNFGVCIKYNIINTLEKEWLIQYRHKAIHQNTQELGLASRQK
jgi:hypothetical protein